MIKVLYIACTSFSGSTLVALLLNTHPEIATVGHTMGWRFPDGERFACSCGASLDECPFWIGVKKAFREAGLPFAYNDFGTRARVVEPERVNRYLIARLPLLASGRLERARDGLVRAVPPWAARLARSERAYVALTHAALAYNGARVYVDNSHTPFQLRHLRRIRELDLSVLHLVRDIRGNVYSQMKNSGWDVEGAARRWLRDQSDISRVLAEFGKTMTVFYEDICDRPDETLGRVCEFMGVSPHTFDGDFGAVEHHVLGNAMRLASTKLRKDARWRDALAPGQLATIERTARAHVRRHPNSPVARLVQHYLG